MKILFTTVLLWSGMFMAHMEAQTKIELIGDSLNIFNRDEIYVRVICPDIYKLIEENSTKELLTSFMDDLESIKGEIPDYKDFQVIYIKGSSSVSYTHLTLPTNREV